jgi:hypothetical protein
VVLEAPEVLPTTLMGHLVDPADLVHPTDTAVMEALERTATLLSLLDRALRAGGAAANVVLVPSLQRLHQGGDHQSQRALRELRLRLLMLEDISEEERRRDIDNGVLYDWCFRLTMCIIKSIVAGRSWL